MSIYYQNTRGLRSKTRQLYLNALNSDHSIICFTETWLNGGVKTGELFDDRYHVVRNDRCHLVSDKSDGGGVLIGLEKSSFKTVIAKPSWKVPTVDMVAVSTTLHNNKKIYVFCIYLEPRFTLTKLELLLSGLEKIIFENPTGDFLIFGDWNIPSFIDYIPGSQLTNIEAKKCEKIWEFLNLCNFSQLNSIKNKNNRTLDLIFSSVDLKFLLCKDPLVKPDDHHPPLVCDFKIKTQPAEIITFTNYKKADFLAMNSIFCNIDWMSLFNNNETVSGCVDTFYNVATKIIDEFSPVVSFKRNHFPKWYSKTTIFLLNEKWRYHRKWKKFRNPSDYRKFSELRTESGRSISSDYSSFIFTSENSIISSPRSFWSFFDQVNSDSSSIPDSISWDNRTSSSTQETAEMFASYFESVYTGNNFVIPETKDFYGISLSSLSISYDEVYERLISLNDDSSSGPDGIPPIVLKNCAFSLTFPLTVLFNISLQTCSFPSAWKTSYVIPIFKSGDKHLAINYRPVCKNSTIAQVFDNIITIKLTSVFENIIAPQQHGFTKQKSTLSNLLSFTETIHESFDEKCQLDAVYTDFSKAFDTIDHSALIFKLSCSGISGDLLRWLESYLRNRFQIVKLGKCFSKGFRTTSGVPQGSHLGPLLFLLFINDLSWILGDSVTVSLFADDLKLFRKIKSLSDIQILQEALDKLFHYCLFLNLRLNVEKCFFISFSRKLNASFPSSYTICDCPLKRVDTIKDLGVILDSKLTYTSHINFCYNKAIKMLGFLFRSCRDFKNVHSLKTIYFSYVRSHLEYCVQIWNPTKLGISAELEKIQRKFVRFLFFKRLVPGFTNFSPNEAIYIYSYHTCLANLNIQLLSSRRKFFDIDLILKTFTNQIKSTEFLQFFTFPLRIRNLRHHQSFLISTTNESSLNRCMRYFNELKLDIDEISSFPYSRSRRMALEILNS